MQGGDTFFYFDGTNVVGPFSAEKISELISKGIITSDTKICSQQNEDWKSASTIMESLQVKPKTSLPPIIKNNLQFGEPPALNKLVLLLILITIAAGLILFAAYGIPLLSFKSRGISEREISTRMALVREENEKKEKRREMEIENAIINKKLMVGMTRSQVLRAWGSPDKKESDLAGGARFEWWYYFNKTPSLIGFLDRGDGEEPKISSDPYKK